MDLKFVFEKETKGAVRFKEQSDKLIVGTIYIKKEALPELGLTAKDNIVVSISKEEK